MRHKLSLCQDGITEKFTEGIFCRLFMSCGEQRPEMSGHGIVADVEAHVYGHIRSYNFTSLVWRFNLKVLRFIRDFLV